MLITDYALGIAKNILKEILSALSAIFYKKKVLCKRKKHFREHFFSREAPSPQKRCLSL